MFRLGRKVAWLQPLTKTKLQRCQQRNLSNGSGSSSGVRSVAIATGVLACGCGGTVVYAKINPDFRRIVEDYVPPTKSAFSLILGPARPKFEPTIPPLTKPKSKKPADPLDAPFKDSRKAVEANKPEPETANSISVETEKQTKEDIPADKAVTKSEPESLLAVASPQPPIITMSSDQSKPEVHAQKDSAEPLVPMKNEQTVIDSSREPATEAQESFEQTLIEQEIETEADNAATSALLDEMLNACSVACSNAILSNIDAANSIALHSSLLRIAVDDTQAGASEKSQQWEDVAQALCDKEKLTEQAKTSFQSALEELGKIKQLIKEINLEKDPNLGAKVIEVDRDCMNMSHDLEEAKSKMRGKLVEAQAFGHYLQEVENAKERFRSELDDKLPALLQEPEWKKSVSPGRLSDNQEDNRALLHMQHRVEELRRELTEERTTRAQRLEDVVASVRSEVEDHVRKLLEIDLEKKLEEQRLTHNEQINELQKAHDDDIRRQLKRQASAHVEHLSEALSYMERQASEKYEREVKARLDQSEREFQEALENERASNEAKTSSIIDQTNLELETALARVRGIEQAVDGRAHAENVSRKAQELSLACDALLVSIRYGNKGKPVPLATELDTMKGICDDNAAVSTFSGAVPADAAERGVYPEEILRGTFHRIGKICRRVSLVDENRNSLYVFILSYLKSLLISSSAQAAPPDQVDQSELDVFSIISYANYCLQHGDLEQATRFVNQLKGEPRRVASDWLKEARLLLETRQAVEALATVAQGLVIGAQLEK